MPIDGGDHRVEAVAPGKKPWSAPITIKTEADAARVVVPPLETPSPEPIVSTTPARSANESPKPRPTPLLGGPSVEQRSDTAPWGTLEWAGVATAGAGVLALGAGGYFLATALDMNSSADCNEDNVCKTEQGVRDRRDAVSNADTATILGIAGGVLVGGGATLFLVGRSNAGGPASKTSAAVSIAAGPEQVGLQVSGAF
jgi:hypothetical protein